MNLIIVESPTKAKSIQNYLGDGWEVKASFGHFRNLPEHELGFDLINFKPQYVFINDGQKIIESLKLASKRAFSSGGEVFLASDPDREGEAIAWHLQQCLGLKQPKRIKFNDVTKKTILESINNPSLIDIKLVASQEARRILDRIVGYEGSPYVQEMLANINLSIGRVQTAALKLLHSRHLLINNHAASSYYTVKFNFNGWSASWPNKNTCTIKTEAEAVSKTTSFTVIKYDISNNKSGPNAPFTTSTLQQSASNNLDFKSSKTMEIAQSLFDKGFISYIRTDNPNLTEETFNDIELFCKKHSIKTNSTKRAWAAKGNAQEAHKAIVPIYIDKKECGDTEDEKLLYNLIWKRTIASHLEDAIFETTNIVLNNDGIEAKASSSKIVYQGFKIISGISEDENESEETENQINLPVLNVGDKINTVKNEVIESKTKAPRRYTEASLTRDLEKYGIGRPATYASILQNITDKKYIVSTKKNKFIDISDKAIEIINLIDGSFSFINLPFTNEMEKQLDQIADGKISYLNVVKNFYELFNNELKDNLSKHRPKESCPKCSHGVILLKNDKKQYFKICYNNLSKKSCDWIEYPKN